MNIARDRDRNKGNLEQNGINEKGWVQRELGNCAERGGDSGADLEDLHIL